MKVEQLGRKSFKKQNYIIMTRAWVRRFHLRVTLFRYDYRRSMRTRRLSRPRRTPRRRIDAGRSAAPAAPAPRPYRSGSNRRAPISTVLPIQTYYYRRDISSVIIAARTCRLPCAPHHMPPV
ncbi:hypothetical protein EVAR_86972_1 [Eumeta japonica]|uniref:Uncharacterized protein n=1 Tax=Eumeta variegata TaxID=151549 RepID=A0A4C1W895_EUMVA|nr:hypothetical protein EVAR_86972_1 [Eumeta japonica]